MAPLTERYNNPGAVEFKPWMQKYGASVGPNGRYAQFATPDQGYGVMGRILDTYAKRGQNTVSSIIGGLPNNPDLAWAPRSVDNNSTPEYIKYVSGQVGVGPNDPLTPEHRMPLMRAMAGYESGRRGAQVGPPGAAPSALGASPIVPRLVSPGAAPSETPIDPSTMVTPSAESVNAAREMGQGLIMRAMDKKPQVTEAGGAGWLQGLAHVVDKAATAYTGRQWMDESDRRDAARQMRDRADVAAVADSFTGAPTVPAVQQGGGAPIVPSMRSSRVESVNIPPPVTPVAPEDATQSSARVDEIASRQAAMNQPQQAGQDRTGQFSPRSLEPTSLAARAQQYVDNHVRDVQTQIQSLRPMLMSQNPAIRENAIKQASALRAQLDSKALQDIKMNYYNTEKAERELTQSQPKIEKWKGEDGTERVGIWDNGQLRDVTPGASGDGTPKAFRDEANKKLAGAYEGYISEGQKAVAATSDLDRMSQLSQALGEGKLSAWLPTAGPWLQSIGIEPNNLSEAQAFQAIASKLAPAMRPTGSGATSDRDMAIFMQSLPQLSQTREGREMVVNQMRAFHTYNAKRAEIASAALTGEINPKQAEAAIKRIPSPFQIMNGDKQAAPQQGAAQGGAPRPQATARPPGGYVWSKEGGIQPAGPSQQTQEGFRVGPDMTQADQQRDAMAKKDWYDPARLWYNMTNPRNAIPVGN